MSKRQAPTGISWGKASDDLKAKVKFVLQSAQNNRYSVSRIYAASNAVFELSEAPQTCSTCLTSRVAKLRKWWGEQAPKDDTQAVPTTGEKHTPAAEADTYEGVVDKYKITFPQGEDADEAEVLANFIAAGVGAKEGLEGGITAGELQLLKQRLDELTADAVAFTPEEAEAPYGIATKGGQPLPEGVYEYEGKRYQVSGEHGSYTELGEGETGHDPKAVQTHFFKEGEMSMLFTPSAEDVSKGAVAWSDGTKVKAGTYVSATGVSIAVQVGSKASIK